MTASKILIPVMMIRLAQCATELSAQLLVEPGQIRPTTLERSSLELPEINAEPKPTLTKIQTIIQDFRSPMDHLRDGIHRSIAEFDNIIQSKNAKPQKSNAVREYYRVEPSNRADIKIPNALLEKIVEVATEYNDIKQEDDMKMTADHWIIYHNTKNKWHGLRGNKSLEVKMAGDDCAQAIANRAESNRSRLDEYVTKFEEIMEKCAVPKDGQYYTTEFYLSKLMEIQEDMMKYFTRHKEYVHRMHRVKQSVLINDLPDIDELLGCSGGRKDIAQRKAWAEKQNKDGPEPRKMLLGRQHSCDPRKPRHSRKIRRNETCAQTITSPDAVKKSDSEDSDEAVE